MRHLTFFITIIFSQIYAFDEGYNVRVRLFAEGEYIILVGGLTYPMKAQYPRGYGLIVTVNPKIYSKIPPERYSDLFSRIMVTSYYVNPDKYQNREEKRGSISLKELLDYSRQEKKTIFLADFGMPHQYRFGVSYINPRQKKETILRAEDYIHVAIASPEATSLYGQYDPFYIEPRPRACMRKTSKK